MDLRGVAVSAQNQPMLADVVCALLLYFDMIPELCTVFKVSHG